MPAAFRWIVERCLAKDVNDRYGVTSDLLRDFRMLRDRFGELVAAQRASSVRPIASGWRRGLLAVALLATFVAGAIVTSFIAVLQRRNSAALTFTPFTTGAGYQGFPAWSPDGQTIAYAADLKRVV